MCRHPSRSGFQPSPPPYRNYRRSSHCSPILFFFFFSSRRRHTSLQGDWSSDVCSSDLHTVSAGVPADGLTGGPADGCAGIAAGSGAAAAVPAVLSGRPPVPRSAVFFGGNRMLGKTATMSIRSTARITRRSTSPLRVCASVRLALRHRVVAARVQRVAAQDASDTEPNASHRAVALPRFVGVARARRHEATLREHQVRQRPLVDANQRHDGTPRPVPEIHVMRVTLVVNSVRSCANGAAYAVRFARTTRSTMGSEATG